MAFVRAPLAAIIVAEKESIEALLARVVSGDVPGRRGAARALSRHPEAASALALCLQSEQEPLVRNALFASLVEIGGTDVANHVAQMVRCGDAALRGGAIEALKALDQAAVPALDVLLADPDPDTRLLAIEVARAWPKERALPRLRHILDTDPHVNVCAAAVDVATEVGTEALAPSLARLTARFPNESFLAFAVEVACSRIGCTAGRGG